MQWILQQVNKQNTWKQNHQNRLLFFDCYVTQMEIMDNEIIDFVDVSLYIRITLSNKKAGKWNLWISYNIIIIICSNWLCRSLKTMCLSRFCNLMLTIWPWNGIKYCFCLHSFFSICKVRAHIIKINKKDNISW